VLHGVRHVDRRPIDARLCERVVEDAPGRPDEGLARPVLLVARLLADEDRLRVRGALAEDGLRADLPEAAPAARRG
jgi:hypothetical protein